MKTKKGRIIEIVLILIGWGILLDLLLLFAIIINVFQLWIVFGIFLGIFVSDVVKGVFKTGQINGEKQ